MITRQKQIEGDIVAHSTDLIGDFYNVKDGHLLLSVAVSGDLFDTALSGGSTPRIKREVFESLDNALSDIKHSDMEKIALEPPSDGAYSQDEFFEIFRKNLSLRLLSLVCDFRRVRRRSIYLLGTGCLLLLASYFFGRVIDSTLIFDVVNILGSLLIWTAGERYFLDQAQNRFLRRRYCMLLDRTSMLHHKS